MPPHGEQLIEWGAASPAYLLAILLILGGWAAWKVANRVADRLIKAFDAISGSMSEVKERLSEQDATRERMHGETLRGHHELARDARHFARNTAAALQANIIGEIRGDGSNPAITSDDLPDPTRPSADPPMDRRRGR